MSASVSGSPGFVSNLMRWNNELDRLARNVLVMAREEQGALRILEEDFARAVRADRRERIREMGRRFTGGSEQGERALAKLAAVGPPAVSATRPALAHEIELILAASRAQKPYSRPIVETLGGEGMERIVTFMNTCPRPLGSGSSDRYSAILKGYVTQAWAQRTAQGIAAGKELLARASDARQLLPHPGLWTVLHEKHEVFGPAFANRKLAERALDPAARLTIDKKTRMLVFSPIQDQPLAWFDESVWLVYPHARTPLAIFTGGIEFKGLKNADQLARQFPGGLERVGLGRVALSIGEAQSLLMPGILRPRMFGAFPTGPGGANVNLARIASQTGMAIDPIDLGQNNDLLWAFSKWLQKEWEKPPKDSLIPVL